MWLDRVLGEAAQVPEPPAQNAIPPDAKAEKSAEEPDVESLPSTEVVGALVQAWHSGNHYDVAAQLLFTPVSYVDFVQLCYEIGQEDAVQLGHMLDELATKEGMVTDVPGENRILSRVMGQEGGNVVSDEPEDAALVPPGERP